MRREAPPLTAETSGVARHLREAEAERVEARGPGTPGLPIGQRVELPGHFDTPVVLEDARALGPRGSGTYECRVRLPDGSLDEVVISAAEAVALAGEAREPVRATRPVDAERLRLLVGSARLRLAYAYDPHFAVSISGIRTLPHQIEAVYRRMLPQPRLRFLLADDPGAGKTIMAGLLIKELKLREAIERILILCPAPLTIQWQDEMLRWFGEPFEIIFGAVDQHLAETYWLYVVWDPLGQAELVRVRNPAAVLDHAKREIVAARFFEIPAEAIEEVAR